MKAFVDRIVADRWSGTLCNEDRIDSPSISDLEHFVDALDAKIRTLINLYGKRGTYLCIGGGAGQYVAYASTHDEEICNLLGDNDDRRTILLNAGGQEGDFPVRQVVDKNRVLIAARTFFRTGQLDSRLRWEKQGHDKG